MVICKKRAALGLAWWALAAAVPSFGGEGSYLDIETANKAWHIRLVDARLTQPEHTGSVTNASDDCRYDDVVFRREGAVLKSVGKFYVPSPIPPGHQAKTWDGFERPPRKIIDGAGNVTARGKERVEIKIREFLPGNSHELIVKLNTPKGIVVLKSDASEHCLRQVCSVCGLQADQAELNAGRTPCQ